MHFLASKVERQKNGILKSYLGLGFPSKAGKQKQKLKKGDGQRKYLWFVFFFCRKRKADACTLWFCRVKFSNDFITACHTDTPGKNARYMSVFLWTLFNGALPLPIQLKPMESLTKSTMLECMGVLLIFYISSYETGSRSSLCNEIRQRKWPSSYVLLWRRCSLGGGFPCCSKLCYNIESTRHFLL